VRSANSRFARVVDDPTIDTTSRTGKLVMGFLALIAEFENDIRRERQMDGIAKAKDRGTRFGRKPELTPERIAEIKALRADGITKVKKRRNSVALPLPLPPNRTFTLTHRLLAMLVWGKSPRPDLNRQ
jgi:resolvase-like protein